MGDLYGAPPVSLGAVIDQTLARVEATRGLSPKGPLIFKSVV